MVGLQSEALKRFNCLYKELDEVYHKLALKTGISDSVFCILYGIAAIGDGCLQKDISEYYSLSRQTVNTSIKKLQSQGYISLMKGNGHDKHIYLTSKGEKFVKEKIIPIVEMENDIFNEMPPEDREEILRLTEEYVRLMKKRSEEKFFL